MACGRDVTGGAVAGRARNRRAERRGSAFVTAGVASIVFSCLGPLGCGVTYVPRIRNDSTTKIRAVVVNDRFLDNRVVLSQAMVSPGESARLGPVEAPFGDAVYLEVSPASGGQDVPEKQKLRSGETSWAVDSGSIQTWGPIVLREALLEDETSTRGEVGFESVPR